MNSVELANLVRRDCIEVSHKCKMSHLGSALSVVDILAVLYSKFIFADGLDKPCRLILSKGHASTALYSVLSRLQLLDRDLLMEQGKDGALLSSHVEAKCPHIDYSTGSLGHGLSVAIGMALVKKQKQDQKKVYCILGDGECNEGSVWEAFIFAGHHKLDNLVVIIDANKMQAMGHTKDILELSGLEKALENLGFESISVSGHDHYELCEAIGRKTCGKPRAIIANTIKGYPISFMEDNIVWHYRCPDDNEYEMALRELDRLEAEA